MLLPIWVLVVATGATAQDVTALSPSTFNKTTPSAPESKLKAALLENFMKEFKKTYENVYYSYQSNTIKAARVWYNDLDAKQQANPDVVLETVLATADLKFEKVNDVYVIKLAASNKIDENFVVPAAAINTTTQVADFAVRGKVSDNNGPVAGVTVSEKGKSNATTTDGEGNFSLSVANSSATLVFSSIGYKTLEVPVAGLSVLNINLESSAQELEGVVVTALGITREKRSLGYSVGQVKGDDLTHVSNENMLTSMSGRVSGVTINQTSGIGSSISVIIRGAKSLGNNQPLYVIDGVPMGSSIANVSEKGSNNKVDYGNNIADINPDDIESISVLKGPSAAALYGSRAGNGVIMITTKSGKKGKGLGVSFSTSNVWEKAYRFLDFHYKYANGDRPFLLDEFSAYWGGLPLDEGNLAEQWNSPVDENGNKIPTELKSYKDNMKNFLNTGFTSTNNVSVSGSGEKTTYRLSYSNMTNKGLIPGSDLFRNSLSFAGSHDITKNLSVSTNINWVRSNSNNRPLTSERNANALQEVYASSYVDVRELKGIWKPGLEGIEQLSAAPGEFNNPYFIAYGIRNGFVRDRLYGNVKLDWKNNSGFSAFVRATMNASNENRETKIAWSYTSLPKGGYYIEDIFDQEVNTDFLVTYKKKVSDLDFSISAGGNYLQGRGRSASMGGRDLSVPNLYRIGNIPRANLSYGNGSYKYIMYSLYGTASLGYKDQVYLDLSSRNDWSSRLRDDNWSFFYPSASLSWLVNKTFSLPSEISLLKLRGGWARSGLDPQATYSIYQTLGTGSWGGLVSTNIQSGLLNPEIKPEINTSIEGGLDLNLFNGRLRFDITYYDMLNRNQIVPVKMPESSGYSSKIVNAGKLRSKGWEIGLGGTPIQSKNWSWDLNANFSKNRVFLEELYPGLTFFEQWGENGGGAYTFVGEEMGNMYSKNFATVTDPNSPYYRWPIIQYNSAGEGDMQWQELSSGSGNPNNVKVGNYNPRFTMGLQSTVTWKRFSLGLSFDWRNGGEFMSFTYRYGESDWKSQRQIDQLIPGGNMSKDEIAALLKSDPEKYIIPQNGYFPRVGGHTQATGGYALPLPGGGTSYDGAFVPGVWQDDDGNYHEWLGADGTQYQPITNVYPWAYNQNVTFDASFIKLREITLGYRIPNLFGITRNATFSVYTRNIMLWNAAKIGIDPERAFWADPGRGGFRQGIERQNVMPWTIPFGFKLNVDF